MTFTVEFRKVPTLQMAANGGKVDMGQVLTTIGTDVLANATAAAASAAAAATAKTAAELAETHAETAEANAAASAAAAAAVGSTNDTIIASRINDPTSATATSLSTTIATQAVGRGEVILLSTDYASVQDACDAAAARASGALAVGGTVLLPLGTTTLTTTLVGNQQGITLRGQGPGSVLKWGGAAGIPMIQILDSARFIVEDMTILGDDTNIPSAGIYFESPTIPLVGTNEDCAVRRVSFGREYTTQSTPNGKMQYGVRVGGAADGNNDSFTIEDCQFHDQTIAGVAISNTQSIWGQLKNLLFNSCAIGLLVNANVECQNLKFNRCAIDLKITQGRVNVAGFYSEHTGLLWDQSTTSSLFVRGGKAIVGFGTDLADSGIWAQSAVAAGNVLALRDLYVVRSAGASLLHISGSSSNTVPSYVYIRGCVLPDGNIDSGYDIDGYAAGTPLHVDIQQGTYWRRQVVQSLSVTSAFTPINSRQLLGPWWQDNLAASQTNVALSDGQPTHAGKTMTRGGYVTALSVRLNIARTAGTLTAQVTKNGSAIGLSAVIDGTNTSSKQTDMPLLSYPFAAGDIIGIRITTDASWLPTTSDLTATVEITT